MGIPITDGATISHSLLLSGPFVFFTLRHSHELAPHRSLLDELVSGLDPLDKGRFERQLNVRVL